MCGVAILRHKMGMNVPVLLRESKEMPCNAGAQVSHKFRQIAEAKPLVGSWDKLSAFSACIQTTLPKYSFCQLTSVALSFDRSTSQPRVSSTTKHNIPPIVPGLLKIQSVFNFADKFITTVNYYYYNYHSSLHESTNQLILSLSLSLSLTHLLTLSLSTLKQQIKRLSHKI